MVGIVLVSHSKDLAEATCKLALQASPQTKIIGVGGTGDRNEEFGTDATQILEAIENVYSQDGVLVLMDMGSAILSAETAIGFLDPDKAVHVKLISAPFVEGAIVAAVQSSIDASLDTIVVETLQSLSPKQEQLKNSSLPVPPTSKKVKEIKIPLEAQSKIYTITNVHGLHARPAANFVQAVSKFNSKVMISHERNGEHIVSAKSLNAIAKLNIRKNDKIKVYVWGDDSNKMFSSLDSLVAEEFGEKMATPNELLDSMEVSGLNEDWEENKKRELIAVSGGIAIGEALCILSTQPQFGEIKTSDAKEEQNQFNKVLRDILEEIKTEITTNSHKESREILKMHGIMLEDPELIERILAQIQDYNYIYEYAVWEVCNSLADEYRQIDNAYLQARDQDVLDIAKRLLKSSSRVKLPYTALDSITTSKVVFIDEVTPDWVSKIDPQIILGVVTGRGSTESHAAILSRSKGIPMVTGYEHFPLVKEGQTVILDSRVPEVIINPSRETIERYQTFLKKSQELRQRIDSEIDQPTITADGMAIQCLANVGSLKDVESIAEKGVEGIGLFRTEFIFFNRKKPPSENEQYALYQKTLEMVSPHSVIIRILDIGGDKKIPYLPQIHEDNPFLGVRGIRFSFRFKKILKVQLRALFRAAYKKNNLQIMLPMVVDEQEIQIFKSISQEVSKELTFQGIPYNQKVKIGIMIETPAAVLGSASLMRDVDFFSIGTNDLTQYVLAAERGNAQISYLYDHCHPSVLRAIQMVSVNDIETSICGEMGTDTEAIPLLLGMGIRKISMAPVSIAKIKYLIRNITIKECKKLLTEAIEFKSATEIRKLVQEKISMVNYLKTNL